MTNVKKLYEDYWHKKVGLERFEDYERNEVLKKLFHHRSEKVLDLASGEGSVSEFLQDLGCDVVALDISKQALKKASARGVKTKLADVEKNLPFENESFDSVFWGDNAEHLFHPENTLKEINRILKPSGRVIISCPNMGYWRYRLYYLFKGMIPQTEWYGQYPWEWEHIRFFNKEVIEDFLQKGGFEVRRFFGVSSRRIDKPFLQTLPALFGMIMVVEVIKP